MKKFSLNDPRFVVNSRTFEDSCLRQHDQFIYCKLDYFVCVFENVSLTFILNDFLKWAISAEDIGNTMSARYYGMAPSYVWSCNNVTISIPADSFYRAQADLSLPFCLLSQVKFPKIRLEISGKGLDYLRSKGFDCDVEFKKLPLCDPESGDFFKPLWHVTRVDFAFDFVNYAGDFLRKCMDWVTPVCLNNPNPCLPLCSGGRPVKISPRHAEHTLYLGSPSSDSLLRIYDKRLQCEKNGDLAKYITAFNVDSLRSFIRVEWQCRTDIAQRFLYTDSDWLSLLKEIYRRYAFYDREKKGPADFWLNLFNWDVIPEIIQNEKYVESYTTPEQLINRVVSNPNLWAVISVLGVSKFLELVQSALLSASDCKSLSSYFKLNRFERSVRLLQDGAFDVSKFKGCVTADGFFLISNDSLDLSI